MAETIGGALDTLFAQIHAKKSEDAAKSYSASLIQGGTQICAKKLGEEAVELALALVLNDKASIKNEAADLLYHFVAAMIAADINPDEIVQTLINRRGTSGHEEKANRK